MQDEWNAYFTCPPIWDDNNDDYIRWEDSYFLEEYNSDNTQSLNIEFSTKELVKYFVQPDSSKQASGDLSRVPKEKIVLDDGEQEFKKEFYAVFTLKKVFKKCFIKQIHNLVLVEELGFKPITRRQTRQKDIYFKDYYPFHNEILKCLRENKVKIQDEILINVAKKI